MKAGKVSGTVLKRSVLKQLHTKRPELCAAPAAGNDFAALALEENEEIVLSVDPVTAAFERLGRIGVLNALNDIAASGAQPVGVLVSLLLPTSVNEEQLRRIMKDIDEACGEAEVQVVGGHTEVTRAVHVPIVTVTGVGKRKKGVKIHTSMIRPGMDILATKWIGLEGTAILAAEREGELLKRFPRPFLEKARAFLEYLSDVPEAAVAAKSGVSAMHDVSEGGIFGALWEMAERAGVGLEIDLKKIPIRQETVEICEFFDINPYKLISGGCMLMAAKDGGALVRTLEAAGIFAAVIGKATAGSDRVLLQGEERRFLETPQTDEIHKV